MGSSLSADRRTRADPGWCQVHSYRYIKTLPLRENRFAWSVATNESLRSHLAAQMAVDAINRNETILRDYDLKLLVADGQCSADMVMKSFIDYLRFKHFNRMVGILGIVKILIRNF